MIDLTKPVQTRDGLKAVIISVNDAAGQPVVAAVRERNGWRIQRFYEDGLWTKLGGLGSNDLVNVPEKVKVWVNLYNETCCSVWPSKEIADLSAIKTRIACVEITYTVGQGL